MRLDMRIKKVGTTKNTTVFEPVCKPGAMKNFYVNTEAVSSLPVDLDKEELGLAISSYPIADGAMALAFPPVPFYKAHISVVQYQHTDEMKAQGRRKSAPARTSTPALPVTKAYVHRVCIDDHLVAERKQLHFAIYLVTAVSSDRTQAAVANVGEVIDRAAALDRLDTFLTDSVREQQGSRLTSRQVWAAWARHCGADPADDLIAGVRFTDVARRFRGVFGVAAAKSPTRIDGRLQRYWSGYAI